MSAAEQLPVEDDVQEQEHPHLELVAGRGKLAALRDELRPYLPTRSALAGPLAGVGAGSAALFGKGWQWLWEDGAREAGIRAGGVGLGAYVGVHTVAVVTGPFVGYALPAAVVAWVVAAKHHAPPEAKTTMGKPAPTDRTPDAGDDEPVLAEEFEPEEQPAIEAGEVAGLIREVAARHDHQGAHLEDLLAEPLFEGWEKGDLKAALTESWGMPVESFKLIFKGPQGRAQRVRDGVRLRHLPQPPAEGAGEGPARGLSVVPSGPSAVGLSKAPAEASVDPSPAAPEGPPQEAG